MEEGEIPNSLGGGVRSAEGGGRGSQGNPARAIKPFFFFFSKKEWIGMLCKRQGSMVVRAGNTEAEAWVQITPPALRRYRSPQALGSPSV